MAGEGIKYDKEKLQFHLVPWNVMKEVVKVMMFGAKKYGENNWKELDDGAKRYRNAAYRHLIARDENEVHDEETKLYHMAHAICSCMFSLWHDIKDMYRKKK